MPITRSRCRPIYLFNCITVCNSHRNSRPGCSVRLIVCNGHKDRTFLIVVLPRPGLSRPWTSNRPSFSNKKINTSPELRFPKRILVFNRWLLGCLCAHAPAAYPKSYGLLSFTLLWPQGSPQNPPQSNKDVQEGSRECAAKSKNLFSLHLADEAGIEPTTPGLEGRCAIA